MLRQMQEKAVKWEEIKINSERNMLKLIKLTGNRPVT